MNVNIQTKKCNNNKNDAYSRRAQKKAPPNCVTNERKHNSTYVNQYLGLHECFHPHTSSLISGRMDAPILNACSLVIIITFPCILVHVNIIHIKENMKEIAEMQISAVAADKKNLSIRYTCYYEWLNG